MWTELANGQSASKSKLRVNVPVRVSPEDIDIFNKANITIPTSTEYSFSSKDGYALSYVESMWSWNRPKHGYPDLTRGLVEERFVTPNHEDQTRLVDDTTFRPSRACTIHRSTCFGAFSKIESASDFFKHIAFRQPKCGDCIVTALIDASGRFGIDKFLPDRDAEILAGFQTKKGTCPPHLPLTSYWKTTDFSKSSAIPECSIKPGMTLRNWCIRLIQRYSYVLGSAAADFYKVETVEGLESELRRVERRVETDLSTTKPVANESLNSLNQIWRPELGGREAPLTFLCLNDDIKETGERRMQVDHLLMEFFRKTWTVSASFERHT